MRLFRSGRISKDMAICAEVMKHLQSYLDGEVQDEFSRRRIAAHLAVCRRCGMEAETYAAIKRSLRDQGDDLEVDDQTLRRLNDFARRLQSETIDLSEPPKESEA